MLPHQELVFDALDQIDYYFTCWQHKTKQGFVVCHTVLIRIAFPVILFCILKTYKQLILPFFYTSENSMMSYCALRLIYADDTRDKHTS